MNEITPSNRFTVTNARFILAVSWFIVIGVIFYLIAIFWFGLSEALSTLKLIGGMNLFAGAALASTAYLWRFKRWEYTLYYFGYNIPRAVNFSIYMAGFALTATPGKAGETFRSFLLLKHKVKAPHSLAAFLVDRSSDVLGMCLLGGIASYLMNYTNTWFWLFIFTVLFFGSCVLAFILSSSRFDFWWIRLTQNFHGSIITRIIEILKAWSGIWRISHVMAFSLIASIAYGSQALVFAWFCHIARTNLAFVDCILIFVHATLLGAASMIPGGLGAMEVALVFQLMERGVDGSVALSLAISIRLVTLWLGLLFGALALLRLSKRNE